MPNERKKLMIGTNISFDIILALVISYTYILYLLEDMKRISVFKFKFLNYLYDLKKQGDLRNSLVLLGGTP